MTAKKAPPWQRRAERIRADLVELVNRKAASYSPEAKRRFSPFVLGPASRLALKQLQDELLPLPPDGKTKVQREREANARKWRGRMKRIPAVKLHMKLTSGRRKILDSLSRGVKLELQFAGQYNDVSALRREGLIERVPHPTVKDRRSEYPADGLQLTAKGRAALAEQK